MKSNFSPVFYLALFESGFDVKCVRSEWFLYTMCLTIVCPPLVTQTPLIRYYQTKSSAFSNRNSDRNSRVSAEIYRSLHHLLLPVTRKVDILQTTIIFFILIRISVGKLRRWLCLLLEIMAIWVVKFPREWNKLKGNLLFIIS